MAKSKYVRKASGEVRGINTTNLNLEKPLGNENYNINIFNNNMDKIDTAINNVNIKVENIEGKVEELELTAEKVSISDVSNKFEATNVEDALLENATKIDNLITEVNGQRLKAITIHSKFDKCL